jgi:hypothetical protein
MDCVLRLTGKCDKGLHRFECGVCNRPYCSRHDDATFIHRPCGSAAASRATFVTPNHGPGTELHSMLQTLGFKIGGPGCGNGCQAWIDRMNHWGVDGCREHRDEIIDHLERQKDNAALSAKLKAGALALAAGLPLTIGGLVDEAINRANKFH